MASNKGIIIALAILVTFGVIILVEARNCAPVHVFKTRKCASIQILSSQREISLNGHPISLEIASTPEARYQGLSDRESLCQSCGMLFTFPDSAPRAFVMRRMRFPLDIVWINQGVIVGIVPDLPPETDGPYTEYKSRGNADTVLELNARGAHAYELSVGQTISL